MSRWQIALTVIAVSLLAAVGGFSLQRWLNPATENSTAPAMSPQSIVGQPLPDFSFVTLAGDQISRTQYSGRPLIINLWATWCGPCREEMPELSAMAQELAPQGVRVLGVALDQPARVAQFLSETPVTYPIALTDTAPGMQFARQLGNRNGVLPYTVFVDASGVITQVKLGVMDGAEIAARAASLTAI